MSTILNDLKYAFRMLRKRPGFTAIALITLALGIGANTAMFSVVNAMVFRPMQVKDPDQLVYCGIRDFGCLTYPIYEEIRADNPAFSDLIALSSYSHSGTWDQGSAVKQMKIMYVSANYFSALGVEPVYGRTFLAEEEQRSADPVVVLSYRAWQELGSDPQMVGQIVHINTRPCRIVAVAPKGFTGTALTGPDIWLPLGACGPVKHYHEERPNNPRSRLIWDYPRIQLVGRLKPELDMAMAEAQLQVLTPRLEALDHRWKDDSKVHLARLGRLFAGEEDDDHKKTASIMSLILMGISSVVLLIACLNLANMLNVQGAQRQREIAIRMAIGGGSLRIIRQLLIESLLLSLFGTVLAVIPALLGVRMLNAWVAVKGGLLIQIPTSFDVRVFGVTLGFCLIATILSGLKPALNVSRRDVIVDLKESGAGVVRSTKRRRCFVPRGLSTICQIALSVAFVMVAILFVRRALKTANTCPGFDLDGKIVVKIDALASGYTPTQAKAACDMLAERLKDSAGIQAVGWSRAFPVGDTNSGLSEKIMAYQPGAKDENAQSLLRRGPFIFWVNGDYFEAMGVPLLQGRSFRLLDSTAKTEEPVIIDERLARKLRAHSKVLDSLIQHGWGSDLELCRVVGVVSDLRYTSGTTSDWSHIYLPIPPDQVPIYMHIRTTPEMESTLLQSLGSMLRKLDPQIKVVSLTSLTGHHRNSATVQLARMNAKVITMFGMLAMFLAGLGLYAIKGHMVATRTSEIGLRMALGATRRDVLALVFRQNAVSTLVGLVLGILLAIGVTSLIRSGLYGISPIDPISIAATVTLLAATSLVAGYIPALRAVKIDPMVALRYE